MHPTDQKVVMAEIDLARGLIANARLETDEGRKTHLLQAAVDLAIIAERFADEALTKPKPVVIMALPAPRVGAWTDWSFGSAAQKTEAA